MIVAPQVCTLIGWGIGWLIGEGVVSHRLIWWLNILKFGAQLPLLMLACGGTAGGCTPERRRVVSPQERRASAELAKLGLDDAGGTRVWRVSACVGGWLPGCNSAGQAVSRPTGAV